MEKGRIDFLFITGKYKTVIYKKGREEPYQRIQLVAFQLGEETYGVDISQVEEIIRLQPITKVP